MESRVELNSETNDEKQQVQLTPIHTIERPLSPSPYCTQVPGAEELQVSNSTGRPPGLRCTILWKVLVVAATAVSSSPLPTCSQSYCGVNCSAVQLQFWFSWPVRLSGALPSLFQVLGPNFDDAAERTCTHPTSDTPSLILLPPSSPYPYNARSIAPGEGSAASGKGTALLDLPAVSRDPAQRIASNRVSSLGR